MSNKGLRANTTTSSHIGADVTGTGVAGNKHALDVYLRGGSLGGSTNTTPKIDNETIASANTEQSYALPSSCKAFVIRNRERRDLRLAYVSGGTSGTNYITVKRGAVFVDENLYSSQTIYFQTPGAGDIIEIATYV